MMLEGGRSHYENNDIQIQKETPVKISDMYNKVYKETKAELVQQAPNTYPCKTIEEYEKCMEEFKLLTQYKEQIENRNTNFIEVLYPAFKKFETTGNPSSVSSIVHRMLKGEVLLPLTLDPKLYIGDVNIARNISDHFTVRYDSHSEVSTKELHGNTSNHPLNGGEFKNTLSESLFNFFTEKNKSIFEFHPENQKYIRSLQLGGIKKFKLMYKPRGLLNNKETEIAFYPSMTIGNPPIPVHPKSKKIGRA